MSQNAGMRQPGARRYSFADHGNSDMGQRQGMYLVKHNLAEVWQPAYGNGFSTYRFFPTIDLDDPTGQSFVPYRTSAQPNHLGDWFRRYPAVRNMGEPGVTFIMCDPADPTITDPQMLPGWVLFNAIDRAVANGQDRQGWAALLRGRAGKGAVLSRPSEVYLGQGCVMHNKGAALNPPRGFNTAEKPIVIALSAGAGLSLLAECNAINPAYQGMDGDWENQFVNGDLVGLDTGRFVTFYKTADGDPRQRQVQGSAGWNLPQQGGQWNNAAQGANRGQEVIGFSCFCETSFSGFPARLREYESVIRQRVRPWEELLWFPTVEEQAALLADKFPPEVVMYAFQGNPEWIPEQVRNRAVASHSLGMAGFGGPVAPQAGMTPFGAPGMLPPPGPAGPWQQPQQAPGVAMHFPVEAQQMPFQAPQQQFVPPAAQGYQDPATMYQAPPTQQLPFQAPPAQQFPPTQPPVQQMPMQQPPQEPAYQAPAAPQQSPFGAPPMGQPPQMGWGTQPNAAVAPPVQQPQPQMPMQQPPVQQMPMQQPLAGFAPPPTQTPMQQAPQAQPYQAPMQQAPMQQPQQPQQPGQPMTRAQMALAAAGRT